MKEILFFYLILNLIILVISFNIDVNNPIIYEDQSKFLKVPPSDKSSYFGYSVFLYPGDAYNAPWVQIGAPRSNSPTLKYYRNPGIIFRCFIGKTCDPIDVDLEVGRVDVRYSNSFIYYTNKMDDAWIGAVMDVNYQSNRTVVCAPRWINFHGAGWNNSDYRMLGACYWSHLNSKKYYKLLPLFTYNLDIYTDKQADKAKQNSVYNYGQGESGLSVHLTAKENKLLIGAPGVFNWKGTPIIFKDEPFNHNIPVESRYTVQKNNEQLTDSEIFHRSVVGNNIPLREPSNFGLFGYSVTSGYFYSPGKLYYASGAPRSKNYMGQVLIYDILQNQKIDVKNTKQGTQFGEYFGGSLAAGDINGDGLDDLFVGAPYHKISKYNEGRMYLFLGSTKESLQEPVEGKFIDGTYVNGQFGTAITYLGDMNMDPSKKSKQNYVAVSAPYEEESGVVYIFRGKRLGLDPTPVQKIIGKTLLSNLAGFGISISKPADIDGNGYADLAIGAYKSGHVVLLRGKPLVRINTYFRGAPKSISDDIKEFTVFICHEFSVYEGESSIRISRKVLVDEDLNRGSLIEGFQETKELILFGDRTNCEKMAIKLDDGRTNNFDPLTIKVTHKLIEEEKKIKRVLISNEINGTDYFCVRCGVYDKFHSIETATKKIPFLLGCKNENICISDVHFESNFKGLKKNTFILGSTNVIDFQTVITNKEENAYSLRIQVDLDESLNFKRIPTACEQNLTRIICPVANPLKKDETKLFTLQLDMNYVNKRIVDDKVVIKVTMLTDSFNKNNKSKSVILDLKTEADISILGASGEQSYSYENVTSSSVEFEQTYQIGKFGLSPISRVRFEIFLPYALSSDPNTVFISVYQPEGRIDGGDSIIFESTIPYLEENKIGSTEGVIEKDEEIENRPRRNVPTAISFSGNIKKESSDTYLLGNSSFNINCNNTDFKCGVISGNTGPFDGSKKAAIFTLRMRLDLKNLTSKFKLNSIIRYSTYGMVKIIDPPTLVQSGERPDMTVVSSLFINDDKKKVDAWVLIVSIILGLLIVLLLTLGLTKLGFFKRAKKEELDHLKAQAGADQEVETEGTRNEGVDDNIDPR